MKKRKMLRRILTDHDKTVQILSTIIIEMIRSAGSGDDDADSGATPDTKLTPRSQPLLKPDPPATDYHQ
jgi:hypothetical protein